MPLIEEGSPFEKLDAKGVDKGLELLLEAMTVSPLALEQSLRTEFFNKDAGAIKAQKRGYKSYPGCQKFPLDKQYQPPPASLETMMRERRACRQFVDSPLSFTDLSYILRTGYGLKSSTNTMSRTSPSGGARHSSEIYCLVLNVSGLPQGLYHYNVVNCELELIREGNFRAEIETFYSGDSETVHNVSAMLVVTAAFQRSVEKYGKRGWKLLLMDTGHLGQNLWLLATSLKLGFCPLAGGFEHDIARFLTVNKYYELPVIAYCLGVPKDGWQR